MSRNSDGSIKDIEGIELPLVQPSLGKTGTSGQRDSFCQKRPSTMRASIIPTLTAIELAAIHRSDLGRGLTHVRAAEILQEVGPNRLSCPRPPSFWRVFLKSCKDVILLVILGAGVVNFFALEERTTGAVMMLVWIGACFINALGEWSTAEGGTALQKLGAATACTLRDGKEVNVPTDTLVPGDVVRVKCGDSVPADMLVADAVDLRVDESVLTGESEDVVKHNGPVPKSHDPFPKNMLYSSTSCVSGKGTGIVSATGMRTQVGMIADRLDVGVGTLAPLQLLMNRVGATMVVCVLATAALITLVCFLARYQDPAHPCTKDDLGCFFWTALAQGLIMGASFVPTSMPIMVTVLLFVARRSISAKEALVRKTSTVETLGSCAVICSDKTGTLTEGKMTVVKVVTPRSEEVNRFAFYPTAGASPYGGIFKEEELSLEKKQVIEEQVATGGVAYPLQNFGASSSSSHVVEAKASLCANREHMRTLLMAASLNSTGAQLQCMEGDKWVTVGNLSEGALVVAAAKAGIGRPNIGRRLNLANPDDLYPAVQEVEIPFSSSRKMACTVHKFRDCTFGGIRAGRDASYFALVKGAPDRLLPWVECSLVNSPDGTLELESGCSDHMRGLIRRENSCMAGSALRVLLLCIRVLSDAELEALRPLEPDERADIVTKKLAVLGAFGILDPPRAAVGSSIAKCKAAGIRVVMITGDQQPTAAAIGLNLKLVHSVDQARLCADLYDSSGRLLSENEIDLLVADTPIWARAQPSDKVTIVESLQRMGFTTAMTGDGVNDAPALKLADIGVAMGITGTEVAKGSSDLVLMNDDFTTIVHAVEEGRRTYSNVQNYLVFYLAMSVPECLVYIICMVSGMALPVTALQMIAQGFFANFIPPLLYYRHPASKDSMFVPPRRKGAKVLNVRLHLVRFILPWSIIWTLGWTAQTVLSMWMFTGFIRSANVIGDNAYEAVSKGMAACEFSSVRTNKGMLLRDTEPFHCVCQVRTWIFGTPSVLTQWGRPILEARDACTTPEYNTAKKFTACISAQRKLRGVKDLVMKLGTYSTPRYSNLEQDPTVVSMLEKCKQEKDDREYWCWKNNNIRLFEKPVLDMETYCGGLGSAASRSVNFVGTAFAKLLLALSVGCDGMIIQSLGLNKVLTVGVGMCGLMFLLIVYITALFPFRITGQQPIEFSTLFTAMTFPLAAHLLLDVGKIFYRWEKMHISDLKKFHVRAIRSGLLTSHATLAEVQQAMLENPAISQSSESFRW